MSEEVQELRELLYAYKAKSSFKEMRHQPCMHKTAACPNSCSHARDVYIFHINSIEVTEGESPDHAKFVTPVKEGTDIHVGADELGDFVGIAKDLSSDDKVEIAWNHDYVTKAGCSMP